MVRSQATYKFTAALTMWFVLQQSLKKNYSFLTLLTVLSYHTHEQTDKHRHTSIQFVHSFALHEAAVFYVELRDNTNEPSLPA